MSAQKFIPNHVRMRRYARYVADVRLLGDREVGRDQLQVRRAGCLTIVRSPALDIHFLRDRDTAQRCKLQGDYVLLQLVLEGKLVGQVGGQNVCLRRGDILLSNMQCLGHVTAKACALLQAIVPGAPVGHDARVAVLPESRMPTRMLAEQMVRSFGELTGPGKAESTLDTFLAVLRLCLDFSRGPGDDSQEKLRTRILTYVEAHLDDPDLGAAALQRKFKLSRAHLYRLFPDSSGVQRKIRAMRLDAAFDDLCRQPTRRIIDVAIAHGFSSERQFQRAFLARFGAAPKQVRAQGRAVPAI